MKPVEKSSFVNDFGKSQCLRQLNLLVTALQILIHYNNKIRIFNLLN